MSTLAWSGPYAPGTLCCVSVSLRAFTTGWITMDRAAFIEGGEGRERIPVVSYLIAHPRGRVVFDTGVHPDIRHDPRGRIGTLADLYDAELPAGTGLDERLGALGADRVDMAVCSHLHFDHCGGNEALGDVPIVVQRTEWEAAHSGDVNGGYQQADFDTGQHVKLVDGGHDLFDDGTVVCVPSPGHTAGHQSLRVTTDAGVFVLTGDACDVREMLDTSRLGVLGYDLDQQRAGLETFRRMEAGGATLRFGHDAAQVPNDEIQNLAG